MDLEGKPSYLRGECPICTERRKQVYVHVTTLNDGRKIEESFALCNDCGTGRGFYQAIKPDHWHIKQAAGVPGYQGALMNRCRGCYLKEHTEVYPDAELPDLSTNADRLPAEPRA